MTGRFGETFLERPDFPGLFFDADAAAWFGAFTASAHQAVLRYGLDDGPLRELFDIWRHARKGTELVVVRGPHELHLYGPGTGPCPVREARLLQIHTLVYLGPAELGPLSYRRSWWRLL